MKKHTEDKRLKSKRKDDEKSILPNPILQDKNNDHSDSAGSTIMMDSMLHLLEEETEKPDSGTNKEDIYAALEATQPTDTDAPDIYTGKLDGLKDLLMEEDQEDAPSDTHNIIDDMPEQQGTSENSPHNDVMADENINKPANVIDSQPVPPETHALRDKPEVTAQDEPEIVSEDEIPILSLADEPVATPTSQLRTMLAVIFGLIGMAGAAGALWASFTLSGHIDQLEAQLSAHQEKIISIKQSMDRLETTISPRKTLPSKATKPMNRHVPTVILPNQSLPPSL